MDQTKSIELQKKRLESAEERAKARASKHVHKPVGDFLNAAPFGDLENFLEKLGCKVLKTY